MIILKRNKPNCILSYILLVILSFVSCKEQRKVDIHRIINGVFVKNYYRYTYGNYSDSFYVLDKDTFVINNISEYDETGNIIKLSIYKPEGVLEYSDVELMSDTLLFQFSGGKSVDNWKFIGYNKITNNIDTLDIETNQNVKGKSIFINRKGDNITIIE